MAFGGTANLSIIITAIDRASGVFKKTGDRLATTGAKMKGIGKGMTMGLTMPIAAVGAASVKMGLDFSKGVEYANTMLKLSGKDLEKFKSGVLDLSDKYGKSATDIAKAGYSVSSVLHTSGEDTVEILDSIAAGAKAGKITTEEAGNAVIRTMSIYNIKAEDSMKVVDTLSATVKAGNANWSDMAQILPQVAGLAKPLGVGFEEVAGAFAAVSSKAGSSAEAGTALRGVLTGLIKPSDEMKGAVKEMGFENTQAALKSIGLQGVLSKLGEKYGDNAEAIGKLFPNIRGITGATALFANGGKDLAEAMDMVKDSTGETQKQIEAGQGPAENFADAMNRLKDAGIRLFETIAPMLTKFIEWVGELAKKFSHLSPTTQKFIAVAGLLAAALGPLLTTFGSILPLLPQIGTAMTFLFTNPFGIAIAAVIALATGATLIVKNWKPISAFFKKLWGDVENIFSSSWAAISGFLERVFSNIRGFFVNAWEDIKGIFSRSINWIMDKIQPLLNVVSRVKNIGSTIGEKVGGFFSGVGSTARNILGFQEGGVVPGVGAQLAVVHGGETIIPRGRAFGDVNVYIQGGNYLDREAGEKFADIIGKMLREQLRYQQ